MSMSNLLGKGFNDRRGVASALVRPIKRLSARSTSILVQINALDACGDLNLM